jgi:hypothetical protein
MLTELHTKKYTGIHFGILRFWGLLRKTIGYSYWLIFVGPTDNPWTKGDGRTFYIYARGSRYGSLAVSPKLFKIKKEEESEIITEFLLSVKWKNNFRHSWETATCWQHLMFPGYFIQQVWTYCTVLCIYLRMFLSFLKCAGLLQRRAGYSGILKQRARQEGKLVESLRDDL